MEWTKPITDRTKADVENAAQRKDALADNKGAYNVSDLNRVERNCVHLQEVLAAHAYNVSIDAKTNWTKEDFPTKSHLNRIRNNIRVLLQGYFTMPGSPAMDFVNTFDWDDANDLEQNILNLKLLTEQMIKGFRYCGGFNFYTGMEVVLP